MNNWAASEIKFLTCPVPAIVLAFSALRGRDTDSIKSQRRRIGIRHSFNGMRPTKLERASRLRLTDFPGADWTASYGSIMAETGVCSNVAVRLRAEAAASIKPHRKGRRAFSFTDFDLDWKSLSTKKIMELTGVSRPLVYRMRKEYLQSNHTDITK